MSPILVPLEIVYPEMRPGSASHSHESDEFNFDDNVEIRFISTRDGDKEKKNAAYKNPITGQ